VPGLILPAGKISNRMAKGRQLCIEAVPRKLLVKVN
jgi:hypothetical protein